MFKKPMQAAAIVPRKTNTFTIPLPVETSSESFDTFLFSSSMDLSICLCLSAVSFSCEDNLMPKDVFTMDFADLLGISLFND
jgi:hypothetical protein|tara:strand:+ start:392 stop:637 length:246 start_codon:yes stop_codon:yes gene_type:complete